MRKHFQVMPPGIHLFRPTLASECEVFEDILIYAIIPDLHITFPLLLTVNTWTFGSIFIMPVNWSIGSNLALLEQIVIQYGEGSLGPRQNVS